MGFDCIKKNHMAGKSIGYFTRQSNLKCKQDVSLLIYFSFCSSKSLAEPYIRYSIKFSNSSRTLSSPVLVSANDETRHFLFIQDFVLMY